MKMLKEEKAQASIEVMFLVAAGIAVAAVIGLWLKSIPGNVEHKINEQRNQIIHGF